MLTSIQILTPRGKPESWGGSNWACPSFQLEMLELTDIMLGGTRLALDFIVQTGISNSNGILRFNYSAGQDFIYPVGTGGANLLKHMGQAGFPRGSGDHLNPFLSKCNQLITAHIGQRDPIKHIQAIGGGEDVISQITVAGKQGQYSFSSIPQ